MPHRTARRSERPPGDTAERRILIVDDSVVARAVIARAVETGGMFVVAGSVAKASAALEFLRDNRVDAIILDIALPGVSGLVALPDLIVAGRGAKVLIVSSSCGEGEPATIEALALGAADTMMKPFAGELAERFSRAISQKLTRLLATEPEPPPPPPATPPATTTAPVRAPHNGFDIVAIGASTGGIHAINLVLRELPAGFPLPILITQHLPESFMPYFAAQVAVIARRPCDVATNSMRIRPGRIVIAPGDAHLRVVSTGQGAALRLSNEAVRSGCTPSVDPMLDSVAEVYGARALAIVLSGMGRDGCDGAAAIIRRGGAVVVQDQASSVVWGMPGAIVGAGSASAVLAPTDIGKLVASQRRPE